MRAVLGVCKCEALSGCEWAECVFEMCVRMLYVGLFVCGLNGHREKERVTVEWELNGKLLREWWVEAGSCQRRVMRWG